MQRIITCLLVFAMAVCMMAEGNTVKAAVDTTPPQITALSANISSEDAIVRGAITSSESGTFFYMVLPEDSKVEVTVSTIRNAVSSKSGIVGSGVVDGISPTSFEISGLMPRTKYIIYAFMTDVAGNDSVRPAASQPFYTANLAVTGTVSVTGLVALDGTLKAVPNFASQQTGDVTYQWYRIALTEDMEELNAPYDETGGAEADMLVADVDEDVLALDGTVVESGGMKAVSTSKKKETYSSVSLENATMISGQDTNAYKVTKDDIGYRLVVRVTASNYIGSIVGYTSTFVPKLMPSFDLPSVEERTYSATRELSAIPLPNGWQWVDKSIVPVADSNGYRAIYTPTTDSDMYKSVVMRIDVPIERKSITSSMAMVFDRSYTGERIKDNFEVADGGDLLTRGRDYIVTYKNNKDVGKGTVYFRGIGNYKSTIKQTYTISRHTVKSLTFTYDDKVAYTGKKRKANLIVENGTLLLKKNKDYTVSYSNNVNVGTATITVVGKGNYSGKKTIQFQIIPKTAKITVQEKKGTSVLLKFSKIKDITGYQIQFSKDEYFESGVQKFSTEQQRMRFRGLNRGDTYYVRVRTYKVIKGKKYYSNYSKTKTIQMPY